MSLVPVPKTENGQTEENSRIPSNPHNLQDLLTLSTRVSTLGHSGDTVSSLDLNDERMKFLNGVLSELHVDHVQTMRNYVCLLDKIQHGGAVEVNVDESIEDLIDLVACLDMAKLFYQLGGLEKTVALLDEKHPSMRCNAAKLIFQCCQNNIYCQQLSTEDKVFVPLMDLAKDHRNSDSACYAMSAIMAIVQNNPAGLEQFRKHDGFSMITNAINSTNKKIVCKGLYLMNVLFGTASNTKEHMVKLNVVGPLITVLKDPDNSDMLMLLEYALRNLVSLADLPEPVATCNLQQYELKDFLRRMIEERKSDEAYQEIVEFAAKLQKRIAT